MQLSCMLQVVLGVYSSPAERPHDGCCHCDRWSGHTCVACCPTPLHIHKSSLCMPTKRKHDAAVCTRNCTPRPVPILRNPAACTFRPMAGSGILCVSVIEAKNVLAADTTSELSFYVRLRLGSNEVKTDTCVHNIAPKFLKDVRLPVPSPSADVLQMDMLQLGARGDLVVGGAELLVSSLVNKGTVVHWFDLKTFSQGVGAQLCCVLRYLPASGSRPVTPSYAIATREARERAVSQAAPGTLQAPGPSATRALFSDTPSASPAPAASPASPAPASKAAQQQANGSAAWAPATPALNTSGPRAARADSTHDSPTQSSPPNGTAAATASGAPAVEPGSPPSTTAVQGAHHGASEAKADRHAGRQNAQLLRRIPLPLATAAGLLVGVVVYVLRRSPALPEACSTDEVSLVSGCFNKTSYERYRQRRGGMNTV